MAIEFVLTDDGSFVLTSDGPSSNPDQSLSAGRVAITGDALAYRAQLQALLPTGAAWPRDDDAWWTAVLDAFAISLARVAARSQALLDEADPRSTFEMLSDWERCAGLPDVCAGQPDTLQERRSSLVSRVTSRGGQTAAYFVLLAESIGYTVTVQEFFQPRCGSARCGNDRLMEDGWAYTWHVLAPETTEVRARSGVSACGERLLNFGNQRLECILLRHKPAHTFLRFVYGA